MMSVVPYSQEVCCEERLVPEYLGFTVEIGGGSYEGAVDILTSRWLACL